MEEVTNDVYKNKNLKNTCFDGEDLCGVDFSGSDLRGSTFRSSVLTNTDFRNTNIRGCDFSNASLEGAKFKSSEVGVDEEKLINLLFESFGIATLLGVSAAESGSSVGISLDDSSIVQSVSGLILASIFSFAGSILFLISSYRFLKSHDNHSLPPSFIVFLIMIAVSSLCIRQAVIFLKTSSSTSFNNVDLSEVEF